MAEGHSVFKSRHREIQNPAVLRNRIGHILDGGELFENFCPPCETNKWEPGELKNFKIIISEVDRVYHYHQMEYTGALCSRDFHDLYARMAYKGRYVYFHAEYSVYIKAHSVIKTAEVVAYLTFDPRLFLGGIVKARCNTQEIRAMMVDDGLPDDDRTSIYWWGHRDRRRYGVPPMSFLCLLKIYQNRKRFNQYKDILPNCMAEDLEEFINIRETIEHQRSLCRRH